MRNLKLVSREPYSVMQSGFGIGSAFFPNEIVIDSPNFSTLILRPDYDVWLGTGTYDDAFLFESPAPDAAKILAKREFFSSIAALKDGVEESVWPRAHNKKLKEYLRNYQFVCGDCDHIFLPDLMKDEPGHRVRMEEHTYFPPKGKPGMEWGPVGASISAYAECPKCGKETRALK